MLTNALRIEISIVVILTLLIIFYLIKNKKLPIKYSLIWLFPIMILIIFLIFPDFLVAITHFLGFQLLSNMIIFLVIGMLLLITLALTVIVSSQKSKINLLIQEVSILKGKNNEKK